MGFIDLVVFCFEGFGGRDVNQPLFEHLICCVSVRVDNWVCVQLLDGFGARELDLVIFIFKRGGADEEDCQRASKQSHCASHADLRFLAQIFFAEDAFQLFGAPEHEERHEDDEHNHCAKGNSENLVEGHASKVARVVVPVVKKWFGFAEEERADKSAEHEEHAVNFAC